MTLLLDGTQIRGHRLKITANLRIESDDMSGQTSSTDKAHKGFKPKTLTVAMAIRYADAQDLRTLMSLAEQTEKGGQPRTYRVVNDTAAAFGVRQAHFSEGVSAREDDTLAQWIIQFTLSERLSNPEKSESRSGKSAVAAQSAPGDGVGGDGKAEDQLSGFEKILKKVDQYIGPAS